MEKGGYFDSRISQFNGGLFDGRDALTLQHTEIGLLFAAANLDWGLIDPIIFGTLFERFLDPDKRAQIGAHYTDPEKIMLIVEPVVALPLRAGVGCYESRDRRDHDPGGWRDRRRRPDASTLGRAKKILRPRSPRPKRSATPLLSGSRIFAFSTPPAVLATFSILPSRR